jgi:hypothetical protein
VEGIGDHERATHTETMKTSCKTGDEGPAQVRKNHEAPYDFR